MNTNQNPKNRLREEILSTKDENIHAAVDEFLSVAQRRHLTPEEMEMLSFGENDTEKGKNFADDDLDYLY